jgi:hypothetical protein
MKIFSLAVAVVFTVSCTAQPSPKASAPQLGPQGSAAQVAAEIKAFDASLRAPPEFVANYSRGVFAMMTEQNKRDCIEDFKRNANDPSSFQIAGDWFIDPYLIPSQSHPSDLINVTLPMRAKNAMGGLVKSELHCYYKFDDPSKRLTFDFSHAGA